MNATVFDGTGAPVDDRRSSSSVRKRLGAEGRELRPSAADTVRFDPSGPASCYAVVANNTYE